MEANEADSVPDEPAKKKTKLFSIKEFRARLPSSEGFTVLQHFLTLCKNADDHDYGFEYLEKGGTCLELFQLLEVNSSIPATIIIEVVHHILLGIVSQHPQFYTPAYEACKYFLNAHLFLINKMLALASTSSERKLMLKLLTAFVTLSRNLAKDILINVNFNPTNLEVLTKHADEKDSVRIALIHLLAAFLVENHYPTMCLLFEKRGLLTSIVHGLQYDSADTVCLVLLTFKTNILENKSVSKSTKMNVFSTPVVKDFVNLYNWTGPRGLNSKKKLQTIDVDEVEKSRVSETVHSFLLVLCTSHAYGVVFKDRQLGVGKSHNKLMLTVLESLEKPWEHSYAGDLVTRIIGACPDLGRVLWNDLKQCLEPRDTAQWYKAISFVGQLTKQLKPSNIEYSVPDFTVNQLAQIIQSLAAPTSVMKTIVPEKFLFDKPELKQHVVTALVCIYEVLEQYLAYAQNYLKPQYFLSLKNLISEHVARTFPNAQSLLDNWSHLDIATILKLLDLYQNDNSRLLENLGTVDFVTFLDSIRNTPDLDNATYLQICALKIFVKFEPELFTPTNEFSVAFPLALTFYFETKDQSVFTTIKLLLKNTGIFDGYLDEIDVWVNSIFELQILEQSTCTNLVEIIKMTSVDIFDYLHKMSNFCRKHCDSNESDDCKHILEMLWNDLCEESPVVIKRRTLSPLILGCVDFLSKNEQTRNFKNYFAGVIVHLLHFQSSRLILTNLVLKHTDLLSDSLIKYVAETPIVLRKSKTRFAQNFSAAFFDGAVGNFLEQHSNEIGQYPGQLEFCLNQALFYFTNLDVNQLTDTHANSCLELVKFAMQQDCDRLHILSKIFRHPILVQEFSLRLIGIRTIFILNIVKKCNTLSINVFLIPYRAKLVNYLRNGIKKCDKKVNYAKTLEVLEICSLDPLNCAEILNVCADWVPSNTDTDFLSFIYNIIVFCLQNLKDMILEDNTVAEIVSTLTFLNNLNNYNSSALATALKIYLQKFPHYFSNMTCQLFESILFRTEYCKENALLASFILERKRPFLCVVEQNFPAIATQKGLMLGLLEIAILLNANDNFLKNAYDQFKPSLLKALQKPQKAGPNFELYKDVAVLLVSKFMEPDEFIVKVHKYETAEVFHVKMLCTLFTKILKHDNTTDVQVNNAILTTIQITNMLFKRQIDNKLLDIIKITNDFFEEVMNVKTKYSFKILCENESFQLHCKFCLKYGLSGNDSFITSLIYISQFTDFDERQAQLILDMASSHSEFLELLLGPHTDCKSKLLELMLVLVKNWPVLMQRNHIPVFLAAYRATLKSGDRIIRILLQMYENAASRTNFYDFKPFLWDTAASTHYSVRQNIQTALWRQPKIGDIFDILQERIVLNTIINYPLDLQLNDCRTICPQTDIYDLSFFLPLFSSLLSPENEVPVYKFAKSGALSLTVIALSSNSRSMRQAACHVLSRWHSHVEARQGGRNRPLWLRYVEALSRGAAALRHYKLNNFATIFWAKMALILTQPYLPLYIPLTYYLGSRATPNLATIPELYTFFNSSHVNYKEMRTFILEVIHDGLRTENDFTVALNSMALKWVMELYDCCVTDDDVDTRTLILRIMQRVCCLGLGKKLLIRGFGLVSWLFDVASNLSKSESQNFLDYIVQILYEIRNENSPNLDLLVLFIIDKGLLRKLSQNSLQQFFELVMFVCNNHSFHVLDQDRLKTLILCTNSIKRCDYLLEYGRQLDVPNKKCVGIEDIIESLVVNWINR